MLAWVARICVLATLGVVAFGVLKLRPVGEPAAQADVPLPQFAPAPHITAESWSVFAPA